MIDDLVELGDKGDKGPQGPEGETGSQGERGSEGSPGVFTVENLSGWLPTPAWDSGWTNAELSHTAVFYHHLGTTNVLIHIQSDAPPDNRNRLVYRKSDTN